MLVVMVVEEVQAPGVVRRTAAGDLARSRSRAYVDGEETWEIGSRWLRKVRCQVKLRLKLRNRVAEERTAPTSFLKVLARLFETYTSSGSPVTLRM